MRIIVDKKLILRKYKPKDKSALYENSQDPFFIKYLEYKKFSKKQFDLWLKKKLNIKDSIFLVIEFDKKPVGTYILNISGIKKQICNLGYGISSKYFGNKIFTKATKKILNKFSYIKKFNAITRVDNVPSIIGLKRLNFKKEGELKSYYFDLKTKKYYNAFIYSYIRYKK